jgi:hypothetical protein
MDYVALIAAAISAVGTAQYVYYVSVARRSPSGTGPPLGRSASGYLWIATALALLALAAGVVGIVG